MKILHLNNCFECSYNSCSECWEPTIGGRAFTAEDLENDFPTWCPLRDVEYMNISAPINAIQRSLTGRKKYLSDCGFTDVQFENDDIIRQYRKAIKILEEANK